MNDYVAKIDHDDSISVSFYIEEDKIMAIGEKMNELNEGAYMNGYNWEAFIHRYLEVNNPELLDGLDTDPEAGMYAAVYEGGDDGQSKADKLVSVIKDLVEHEDKIYSFLQAEGDHIEWD